MHMTHMFIISFLSPVNKDKDYARDSSAMLINNMNMSNPSITYRSTKLFLKIISMYVFIALDSTV